MSAIRHCSLLLALWLVSLGLSAQITYPYNGVYDQRDGHFAFTNATIVPAPGQELQNATLIIRSGRIVAVGTGLSVPAGAVEVDLRGKYIYPSFVEPYGDYGIPEAKAVGERPERQPQMLSNKKGAYAWNEALKPEFSAHEHFTVDAKQADELRKAGFGTVVSHQMDGISRGSSTAVGLAEDSPNEVILWESVAHHLSFRKGESTQAYPSSLMGSVALLRQTYLDADWYTQQTGIEVNLSLGAWNAAANLRQVFEVSSWQDLLRAQGIADEFNLSYIYKGAGDEYQRLDAVKATGASLIVPLKFPDAYDLEDPYGASLVTLEQLRHWERAPGNAAALAGADINFVFTANGLKKTGDFLGAIRKAIEYGLSEEAALRAITEGPAQLLGIETEVGTLEAGKRASFLVTSASIFSEDMKIHHNWVLGNPYVLKALIQPTLSGEYRLEVDGKKYTLVAEGEAGKEKLKIKLKKDATLDVKHKFSGESISLRFQPEGATGFFRLSGTPNNTGWAGEGKDPAGNWIDWQLSLEKEEQEKSDDETDKEKKDQTFVSNLTYPLQSYGWTTLPEAERTVIRNATVWTNEAAGILVNTDVLIENGRIAAIGSDLDAGDAIEVDGTGKHLTPGIIDEHSHIALSSVNEGSQSSSAEVRMTDVIDATDVDIYRQLAGGVTTSQLLHGSANPIGGQSAIVKLRWGRTPEEMVFKAAPGFIKFALGENVKQSNWGDDYTSRYPQTRMGVEQVFESYFTRAEEYEKAKARGGENFRRDLELEALLEIIKGERFITCHSYQQGEINMLMKVAERHNFVVNTFTHILEGYKVADIMAEHGAGGSTFSDWWAYKFEVVEAIPHNAAIMHNQGVVVAINSDDAEMARRLNQEAAKAVLFGGVPEEEALKFVTLNPAKLLHIDDRVGSIKTGKDADLVLWSDNPLSIYAIAENTFVDGIEYYSREKDKAVRQRINQERNLLIQKSLDAKAGGAATQKPKGKAKRYLHCDTLDHQEDHGQGHSHNHGHGVHFGAH